jgi:16S rRNA (cytosine1402-N4)-methyltransferase
MYVFYHKPVLFEEVIEYLVIKADGIYIDGTAGGGGHLSGIYERLNEKGILIAIDRDLTALQASEHKIKSVVGQAKIIFEKGDFRNLKSICRSYNIKGTNGILLDLGVSSHQLDETYRGFSYMEDSPLDMRMDRAAELTAENIVNDYEPEKIRNIIKTYGEERWASRITDFIIETRKKKRIKTSKELVGIIKAAIPAAARRKGPHPAKRTFQALRIEVNDELGALKEGIEEAIEVLKPGGRLCIITFHSLEDRIVKRAFKKNENPCKYSNELSTFECGEVKKLKVITKKPVRASENELNGNPRARSAKLRVAERI